MIDLSALLKPEGILGFAPGERIEDLMKTSRHTVRPAQPGIHEVSCGDGELVLTSRDGVVVEVDWRRRFETEEQQRDAGNALRRELRRLYGKAAGKPQFPSWNGSRGRYWTSQWKGRTTPDGSSGGFHLKLVLDDDGRARAARAPAPAPATLAPVALAPVALDPEVRSDAADAPPGVTSVTARHLLARAALAPLEELFAKPVDEVRRRLAERLGAPGLRIAVTDGWRHPDVPVTTEMRASAYFSDPARVHTIGLTVECEAPLVDGVAPAPFVAELIACWEEVQAFLEAQCGPLAKAKTCYPQKRPVVAAAGALKGPLRERCTFSRGHLEHEAHLVAGKVLRYDLHLTYHAPPA